MPQVTSIKTFNTNALLFLLFYFFKRTSGLHKKDLSNQLSNPSANLGLRIKQPEF